MKIIQTVVVYSLLAFALGSAQTLEKTKVVGWFDDPRAVINVDEDSYLSPCDGRLDFGEKSYKFWENLYRHYFYENFGAEPPGLIFESVIEDSSLYIVGAKICFGKNKLYQIPENMEPIDVPLKVIFPEANSDRVPANFVTVEATLSFSAEGIALLLVQDGRIFRFYQDLSFEDDSVYLHFSAKDVDKMNNEKYDLKDPRFVELMERLKPYYGEKLWEKVKRNLDGWAAIKKNQ